MRRKFFACFLVVTVLLCVAVCTLWTRSHLSEDPDRLILIPRTYGAWSLESHPGGLLFTETHWFGGDDDVFFHRALGFNYYSFPGDNYHFTSLLVPHWFAALLTALPSVVVATRRFFRSRPGAGHCQACGYDLRATPGRCPECGAVAAEAPA